MSSRLVRPFVFSALLLLAPSLVYAQATLAGVVRDSSGGALPGVTVEAASPVLIEKVRTAITDNTGQYRIVDLRPGVYTVTFTLQGFSTVRREEIDLAGVAVRTVDADLKVGAVTEAIVVTGETPTVDTQSVRRESVIDNSIINSLPVARGYGDVTLAVPTLQGGPLNSSVNSLSVLPNFFTTHGGRGNEGNVQIDGMNVGAAFNGAGVSGNAYDIANAREMQLTLSGALGEAETGGPALNLVSGGGGNRFAGTLFTSAAGEWSQGDNIDEDLEALGISDPAALIKSWDISGTIGGPIKRDKLWFFFTYRDYGNHTDIPGLYANLTAGNPASREYIPDTSLKARGATSKTVAAGRLTAQATPRHKIGFYYDYQWDCDQGAQNQDSSSCRPRGDDWVLGSSFFGPAWSPEAISNYWDGRERIMQLTWQSPTTTKLLLDAGYSSFVSHWGWMKQPGAPLDLAAVLNVNRCPSPTPADCTATMFYRGIGWADMQDNEQENKQWRASASYVTGAHNMKLGYQGAHYVQEHELLTNDTQLRYLVVGAGPTPFPLSFDMLIRPWETSNRTQMHAVYVQDQWTLGRATVQGALRYDTARSWFPAEHNGVPTATRFNTAPITFPRRDGVTGYHDLTPRLGLAYDLFGTGRTSVKINLGKYLQRANNEGTYVISNPSTTFQHVTTRAWFDADGDFEPDCNFLSNTINGECIGVNGVPDLGNFGNTTAVTDVNQDVLSGWGVRAYDWQFGASVQHEVLPRVSVEAGYHRRWFGNFFVTDNVNLAPGDFRLVTVTAPQSDNLPDGGGFQEQFYLPPAVAPTIQNTFTFASDYGDWTQYWHGVDVTVVARLRNGLTLQGGTSTGRGVLDNCDVVNAVPEMLNPALTTPGQNPTTTTTQPAGSCDRADKVLTQLRGNATYVIPTIDVLVSGIFRSQPNAAVGTLDNLGSNGQGLSAIYAYNDNGVTRNVNLLQPGQYYSDRVNQLDLRVGKILRFGSTRANVALDFLNVFNSNTVTAFNQSFSDATINNYLRPTQILNPRFIRFNVTVDY